MTDHVVESGDVPIAIRDYGGGGSPALLLHGAGGNLTSRDVVGPLLSASHRTVAVDLRGHGESGDGPGSWDAVVTDLEAVTAELNIDRPAVVVHSLGGGLGAWWALRHPECPAVVNLDDMLAAHSAIATSYGLDPDRWTAGVRRGLIRRDGATVMRPGPEVTQAIRRDTQSDSLPVFAKLTTPFLLVLATHSLPEVPAELEPLMVAFRARLRRDLDLLIAGRPNLHLREIDASHAVLFEQPHDVTEIITTFIADARGE